MKNLQQMQKTLKQVKQSQGRLQKHLEDLVVEASAGGGLVTVKMNGQKLLVGVTIDREAAAAGDLEMLQDLIQAAVNEASRKVDEQLAKQVGNLAGGLTFPALT